MTETRSLHEIFLSNGQSAISKWPHYFDIYERHFRRFVGRSPVMLEIGVLKGGSLRMWREYFGPGAKIVGLDINESCREAAADSIDIVIGSQSDPSVIEALTQRYCFDIVLDDGSHMMKDVNATFEMLYDRISPRGTYMVEDLHTSYRPRWDGGVGVPGTFMENVKGKIDELHALYPKGSTPTEFTQTTASINIYDSIVVFEKAPQGARFPVTTGAMAEVPSKEFR